MKKVIMAAAIVCVATFAHAAACTWSLTSVQPSATSGALAKDSMLGYFMDGSTYKDFIALDSSKVAGYVSANALSSATLAVARGSGSVGTSFGSFDVGSEVSGYIVIFDNASAADAEYFANTLVQSVKVPGAGSAKIAADFASGTAGWQAISAAPGPTPGGVPEPTSGLLLVLGGAALALRRRR